MEVGQRVKVVKNMLLGHTDTFIGQYGVIEEITDDRDLNVVVTLDSGGLAAFDEEELSEGEWYVRHTHSTEARRRWHMVTALKDGIANTVCGQTFKYPSSNVVFVSSLNHRRHKCQDGCYK